VARTANLTVTPSGRSLALEARKVDCVIEFFRTRPPDRPFDEVATLHLSGNVDAWDAQERIRRSACEIGADAIVVTRDYAWGSMTGTAVSYPDVRSDPGARLARDARGILDLMPPHGFSVATTRAATGLLEASYPFAEAKGELQSGVALWATRGAGGVCEIRHPDGRQGWVDCAALEFRAPLPDGKPPAAPAAPAGPTPTSI
jgi:hypothetical protein